MPPEVMQTALLQDWVIVTRKTVKDGVTICHTKYPIPKETIEKIANTYLVDGLVGYEKGYSYKITDRLGSICKVTVERIITDEVAPVHDA